MKQIFIIKRMKGTVAEIEQFVSNVRGVKNVDYDSLSGHMAVEYDEETVSDSDIVGAIKNRGGAAEALQKTGSKLRQREIPLVKRFCISLLCVVLLLFLFADQRMDWTLFEIILVSLTIAVNYKIYSRGFTGLLFAKPNLDTLIALGSASAVLLLHFASAALMLAVVLFGKMLGEKRSEWTANFADSASRTFVPAVIAAAFGVMLFWIFRGIGFTAALTAGLSMLIVACPCGFGLVTPVGVFWRAALFSLSSVMAAGFILYPFAGLSVNLVVAAVTILCCSGYIMARESRQWEAFAKG